MAELRENVIEWITGDDRFTFTLTQKRMISKARRLVNYYCARNGDQADILENDDGSVFGHLPLSVLRFTQPTISCLTEEEKREAAERLAAGRAASANAKGEQNADGGERNVYGGEQNADENERL